jgi:hypothetical protein
LPAHRNSQQEIIPILTQSRRIAGASEFPAGNHSDADAFPAHRNDYKHAFSDVSIWPNQENFPQIRVCSSIPMHHFWKNPC